MVFISGKLDNINHAYVLFSLNKIYSMVVSSHIYTAFQMKYLKQSQTILN